MSHKVVFTYKFRCDACSTEALVHDVTPALPDGWWVDETDYGWSRELCGGCKEKHWDERFPHRSAP